MADLGSAPAPIRILLVEDDPAIREILASALSDSERTVEAAHSAEDAAQALDGEDFHLVVLDIGLPGMSGLELLEAIRARGSEVPVIIVTGADSLAERLAGFDRGADDYVLKPVSVPEFQRRVAAVLRRTLGPKRFGALLLGPSGLVIDLGAQQVRVGDAPIELTARQFEVLRFLLEHRGCVMNSEEISVSVWGYGTFGSPNFVEAQVSRIRARLDAAGAPAVIQTLRGSGYVIR